MRSVLISVSRFFKKFTTPPAPGKGKLDQSRLFGMYMSEANSRDTFSSEYQQTRQRRNNKHTHVRERD